MNMRGDQNADGSLAPHVVPEVGGQAVGAANPLPVTGTLNAAEGTPADAPYAGSGNATIIGALKGLYASLVSVMPGNPVGTGLAGLNTVGAVAQANGDPCSSLTHSFKTISISGATATNIIAGNPARRTYVCHLFLLGAAADNVAVVEGTPGGNCGAGTAGIIGGATTATGINLAANQGWVEGSGSNAVAATATAGNDVCLITSAPTQLSGVAVYVQQ